jgi:hypothetical protein
VVIVKLPLPSPFKMKHTGIAGNIVFPDKPVKPGAFVAVGVCAQ